MQDGVYAVDPAVRRPSPRAQIGTGGTNRSRDEYRKDRCSVSSVSLLSITLCVSFRTLKVRVSTEDLLV